MDSNMDNMDKEKRKSSISRMVLRRIREIAEQDSIVSKWEDSAYGEIQKITNPKKGVLGERLVAEWLDEIGYLSEDHGYDRAAGGGNFDTLVLIDDNLEKVEVKLATQDTNDKYQFNWIAVEHDIALIVFVAIDPDSIHLAVKTRDEIMGYLKNPTRGRKLTRVPPGNPTHVKWTASKESAGLVEVKTLGDVADLFKKAMDDFATKRANKG